MSDSFLTMLLNLKGMTPDSLLCFFLLIFCRLAPITALTPFLGGKVVPSVTKAGLAFFLGIVFLPNVIATSSTIVDFNFAFLGYSIKELLIGTMLATLSNIPFYIVESAGSIIDYQRGASQLMSQDPTMKVQASSLGILFNYILLALFFELNGPLYFFDGISESFRVFPVDGMISSNFFNINTPFWQDILSLMGYLFALSIQMSAPALVAVLMAETFLGIANRLAPQVQMSFLGMPLKSVLALFVLWVGWGVIIKAFGKQSIDYILHINSLMRTFNPL